MSGKNDSGKSNFIRALNLFFNNNTDFQTALSFYSDFSNRRLSEVRKESIKGKQFISIEIEFIRPKNYAGSLPEKFEVKRKWHRNQEKYEETTNLESLGKLEKLPKTLSVATQNLSAFLNRIHFEYVPAVKDRGYFRHLLQRLQSSLFDASIEDDSQIKTIADSLAEHISAKTVVLQEDFKRASGISSQIDPPKTHAALFNSFNVGTMHGEHLVPLFNRGDGLQARYVPSVLDYIAKISNKFFIWGYEEPENSLEMTQADKMASDFKDVYSKRSQIFVTTHSPAFISIGGSQTSLYRIYQENNSTQIHHDSKDNERKVRHKVRSELGILDLYRDVHKRYKQRLSEISALREKVDVMLEEQRQSQKPLVIVEGDHDQTILEAVWGIINPGQPMPFIVRSSDNIPEFEDGTNGGASAVARMIESIHPEDGRIAIGLFDFDDEGIKEFNNLSKNFRPLPKDASIKAHQNKAAYSMTLFADNAYCTNKNLSMEMMFPEEVLNMKNEEGHGLIFGEIKLKGIQTNVGLLAIEAGQALDTEKYKYKRKIIDGKSAFANDVVPTLTVDKTQSFLPLFDKISTLISSIQATSKKRKRS